MSAAVHTGAISNRQVDANSPQPPVRPRLSLRHSQFRPYVQVLCGGVYMTSGAPLAGAQQTAFAMTAGGLDIRINKLLSFRPVALDYELTRLQNLRTAGDNIQNSLRYTTGFNFTFGAR